MSPSPWPPRLLIGGALGAVALALSASTSSGTLWASAAATVFAGAGIYLAWFNARGPGAVITGLAGHWLSLPGAKVSQRRVVVHDGRQPIAIDFARGRSRGSMRAALSALGPGTELAFKVCRQGTPLPPWSLKTGNAGGPEVSRVPLVEARFAGVLHIVTNDRAHLERLVAPSVWTAVLGAHKAHGEAFRGVTFDGRELTSHWEGPIVSDPARMAAAARALWAPFYTE